MPFAACACGRRVEGPAGDAVCPGCGNVLTIAPDRIRFACACGAPLAAAPSLAGRKVRCPRCGQPAPVPEFEVPPPASAAEIPSGQAPSRGSWVRYALAAALLPLLVLLIVSQEDAEDRFRRTLEAHPEVAERLDRLEDPEDLFRFLPEQRLEGALHGRFTWAHWLYALASATAFWLFIRAFWPMGNATSGQLWFLGILVGTAGILLLLAVQWIALRTRGFVVGGGVGMIVSLVIRFIGYSYRAALDPENGFFLSMLGFTFGVGLCEELCKSLPLLIMARRQAALDARGLALLGLATGIGFGVSEGITYASDMYNGISGGLIYVVRFVSCVSLHAVWSASSALLLWEAQAEIDGVDAWWDWPLPVLKVVGISMILHGAYDTFLKREMEVLALLTAVASFAWFFWLYERTVAVEAAAARPA